MKKLKVLLIIVGFALQTSGQSLLDIYKTGTLKLVPEEEYAKGVSWDVVFPDSQKKLKGLPTDLHESVDLNKNLAVGLNKSLAVAPDGSVFVGNKSSHSISKFDPKGQFLFTFGKQGKGEEDFKGNPTMGGVVGGKYVFTFEVNGHVKLFTLDGKFVKNIKLDYMPLRAVALQSNGIAVLGHVPMKNSVRYVITVINPDTGETEIIKKFDNLWGREYSLVLKKPQFVISFIPMFSKEDLIIRGLPDGNILFGTTFSNSLSVFSPNGKHVKDVTLEYKSLPYPEDLKKEFVTRMEQRVHDGKFTKDDIEPIYGENFFRKTMPYYYNFMVDAEGNILVFKFTDEDVDHKFNVYTYDGSGKFVGEVTLESTGYSMALEYRIENVVFHNDKAIGILNLQKDSSVPPQLLRFHLKGK